MVPMNKVKMMKPEIIEKTVRDLFLQDKINLDSKHKEISRVQYVDKVVSMPAEMQRLASQTSENSNVDIFVLWVVEVFKGFLRTKFRQRFFA